MKKIVLSLMAVVLLASCTPKEAVETAAEQAIDKKTIVIDNILNRRSIRAYKPEQVSKGELDTILQCAINAPSANNKQPWEVRVTQNAEMLAKIKDIGGSFYGAPTLIVVAKDKNNAFGGFDSGLLTQNLLLSAESMGLGTCVLGSVGFLLEDPKSKEIKDALGFSPDYEVAVVIALGYKNETPEAKPREAAKAKFID